MIKLKTIQKHVTSEENTGADIKLSLLKKDIHTNSGKCEYSIVSETDKNLSVIGVGNNSIVADIVFNVFEKEGVTPENLEDIAADFEII